MLRFLLIALLGTASVAVAQSSKPVTDPDATSAITSLRNELIDSFNKGDLTRLMSHLDSDVVITWQNGEVCRGPEQVKAYYDKMMTGPDRIVSSVSSDPQVTDRHVYGDWAVSWGKMNDHFKLTDGRDLTMDSKFTATVAKRGDAWKVTSFHLSVNAFDNSILRLVATKATLWTGGIAGGLALLVGILIGRSMRRKAA